MDDGKGRGKTKSTKGKFKSKRSPEEIMHAAQINALRESESLPKKSPGSVSRAKARSAAFHAAKAASSDARNIGPPAVKPPPPPPPPSRDRRGASAEPESQGVRLVERGEATPANLEGEAEASAVRLKERGEVLPRESEGQEEATPLREKRRADVQLIGYATRKRGELLPRSSQSLTQESVQQKAPRGELLPQDAKALETDSETEQEPPSSSNRMPAPTPWERRVKKREASEPSGVSADSRNVRRLSSTDWLPSELAFEWQEGGDKMVFEAEDMLLKLSTVTQYPEDKVLLASELRGARGETLAFHFLAYVGCLLTYVTALGITAQDTGISNLGGVLVDGGLAGVTLPISASER
ncbi:unnamed protein product [Symbiodinium sp. CCMP2456]|nr:unnamed protein product [Symbiodinium sp. CCMP2456]